MSYRDAVHDKWLKTVPVPEEGLFVPPTLIEIDAIEELKQEWFGPILHYATWPSGTLIETIGRINEKGFGLTMGLHSRIARAAAVNEAHAPIGKLYCTRSMIGAEWGSQPLGRDRLSDVGKE